jgi:hypothetical protein
MPSPGACDDGTMRTAIVSDLHLGAAADVDLLRRPEIRARLLAALADVDRLVLLGDTIELRDRPISDAVGAARPFFEEVGVAMAGSEVVLVPGNHDHRLLGGWLDSARDGEREIGAEEPIENPHSCLGRVGEWLGPARLTISYPGIWVRDDVYATHGHYLDSHVTLPTIERLSVATVDRIGGRPTGVREGPRDYEQVHAPVYDLLFNLAQGVRRHNDAGRPPSMRIWELLGGASGRARTWQGRVLGSAVIPAALQGLKRGGVGSFGRDFSLAEIGRSGVEAMHAVVERLGVGDRAAHVIFGHIHRRGPLRGEDGRRASDPEWERREVLLHNTGSWVYVPAMLGTTISESPFWPGRMIVVGPEGEPEPRELLADADHAELAPPGWPVASRRG